MHSFDACMWYLQGVSPAYEAQPTFAIALLRDGKRTHARVDGMVLLLSKKSSLITPRPPGEY